MSEFYQEQVDQAVVDERLRDIDTYRQSHPDGPWAQRVQGAETYIDELYDAYAPELTEAQRRVGRELGAVGLALVECWYGPNDQAPGVYSGSHEGEIVATYHHAEHSKQFMRNKFRYMTAVNERDGDVYDEEDFMYGPVDAAFHDSIMGNGRGNDERQSGLLAAQLLVPYEVSQEAINRTRAGVEGTTWDDELGAQSVRDSDPYVANRRAAAMGDLVASIFDRTAPYQGLALFPEEMCKLKLGQVFAREARNRGFDLHGKTVDECLEFVDGSDLLRSRFGLYVAGQGGFYRGFRPADLGADDIFPGRKENAEWYDAAADEYHGGTINAVGLLRAARDYAKA